MHSWEVAQGAIALEVKPVGHASNLLAFFERVLQEPFAVLLDSAAPGSRHSQQSVIAVAPWAVLVARSSPSLAEAEALIELHTWREQRFGPPAELQRYHGAAFVELARMLEQQRLPPELRAHAPAGFMGGAIGFVGYDAGRFLEHVPQRAARDLPIPELCMLFVDAALVLDHASGLARWVVTARGPDQRRARARCTRLLAELEARFDEPPDCARASGAAGVGALRPQLDAAGYAALVTAAKAHVFAGDAFEVCVSQRLEVSFPRDRTSAWALYLALRAQSPAPFACCVLTPWACLLSSSPERFLQLTPEGYAESRPIKGTRPRGDSAERDAQLRRELETSDKDRAENIMIVDLVRNDLGRVCAVDSVHVPELMIVESHPSVFQLVSTVRGRLDDGVSALQLFCACFPPGSMTGAPKIEAMKIIDALEPCRRGVYAGAVGYFDLGGGMDFSVVIRSFVICDGRCTFSVGGAVVADSEPAAEYRESMDKARALIAALQRVAAGPCP